MATVLAPLAPAACAQPATMLPVMSPAFAPVTFAALARGAYDNSFFRLVTSLHRDALLLLASRSNHHFQGLAIGARHLKLQPRTRRKLRELDSCAGWVRHISAQRNRDFLAEKALELSGAA